MTLSLEQKQTALEAVLYYVDIASAAFGTRFIVPDLCFNQRGKLAGTAHLHKNLIKLNPVLMLDNYAHFISDVVPHEVAHILTYQRFGKTKPHGAEWRYLMVEIFNKKPITTHSLNVDKVKSKEFSYRCHCGETPLSIRRHNKVVRGECKYVCKRCRGELKPAVSEHLV